MARPKRPPHPMLRVARAHLSKLAPELRSSTRLRLRQLDGPPGSPRFAVSVDMCRNVGVCAYGVTDTDTCPIFACTQRRAIRLLLSREGELLQVITDGLRWEK
ncbi:MAG: hypothetical protein WCF99_06735 [Chloroflexales bacterium]